MQTRKLWNNDWEFTFDPLCGDELPTQARWQPVTLPHDWQIWHTENLYEDGTGWYRKRLTWQEPLECSLEFEGVYMDSTVYVNGKMAAQWKYGYSSFRVDAAEFLCPGENEILVRVQVRHPNSRWYSGAGIYRDVWLLGCPKTHLVAEGLYIAPKEQEKGEWLVHLSSEAENTLPGDEVRYTLSFEGKPVAVVTGKPNEPVSLRVQNPQLWDIGSPNRYLVTAELCRGEEILDRVESVCGFRTIEADPQRGFFLNHRRVVLKGVCLHHDLGCLGAAFNESAARRQLTIMQDMGANALRTAHNMPAPAVMDLADELGILVVTEAFDYWKRGKTKYDYARFFPEWYARDMASWMRRDRNHPSLIMWSVGNEVYDTHQSPAGRDTLISLLEEVKRHDPHKNALTTFGSNYMAWENTQNCAGLVDAVGYNYGEGLYENHHAAHPDWAIYGSETASIVQSRGIYHFPLSQPLLVDDDLQCSSLGNSRTSWGAKSHQSCAASDELYPYTLGQFLWSGIDYIGEPTPYHTKNSYLGLVDTAGFPKDAFYAYQAAWHSWREKPVLHLLPYWDFNPGQKIDICVLSNLPQVELLVNGVSQGKRLLAGGSDNQTHWQVIYAPGTVEAIGYDDQGREVLRSRERSFSDGTALQIQADRAIIDAGKRELVFCTVTLLDRDGNPVRNANTPVRVRAEGALQLVGLDNGDSTDYGEYKTDSRRLFSGMLLAVAAGWKEGTGKLTVTGEGLTEASVTVEVRGSGELMLPEIQKAEGLEPQRPRKIELTAERNILTPEAPETVIRAKLLPTGVTGELSWRVTDVQGITVSNVALTPVEGDPHAVRCTGVGDGSVRIRCACGLLLSDLELEVQDMGELYLNPYEFVGAGLYSSTLGEIGNGNERGVATSRTQMSAVVYNRLDFGSDSADTLTISVFELAGVPTPIRFWKGIPYAPGSKMIGQRIYDKPTTWNVYKDETFRLDECLTGRDVFAIELQSKVHIKGFSFHKRSRAWDEISALAYDTVYGDSYTLTPAAVEGIGNNVSLIFRDLDFGPEGLRGIAIRGKSKLENNTIHLRFEGDGEPQRRIVEFPGADNWQELVFLLEPVFGRQDVTFLFLPGCDFDFHSFRFLKEDEHF